MKKAAIYLRVSTTDQNYDRQKEELTDFAKSLGYDIVSVFEEKKSAVLRMDTRDQLTEMRKLTKEDVEKIFIWDITRLSRRSIDFINLVYEFAEKKICLHFKDNNLITLDKNDNLDGITSMYLYMLGVFAQMDAENLKSKMKSGKESALLKGNSYTNIAPFGYYLKDKHIYIKEEEAKFVRQAFELYKEGKGTQYIADIFNANNIPLKSKNKNIVWVKGTIAQILNNTVYYGKGERVSIIKATNNSPAQKTIKYYDTPAIISKELYDECRKQASLNISKHSKSRKVITLLRGLLVCGRCGRYYVIGNNNHQKTYKDGDIRANINQRKGCKNGSINTEIADKIVWEAIKGVYEYKTFKEKFALEKEKNKQLVIDNQSQIDELTSSITSLDKEIVKVNTGYTRGVFNDDEAIIEKARINGEKGRLNSIIEELRAQNLILNDKINVNLDYTSGFFTRELSVEEKKQVCNDLIEVIYIYSYNQFKRFFVIKLVGGYEIYLFYNNKSCKRFALTDESVQFNDIKNLSDEILTALPEKTKNKMKDFTITSNNNSLFSENEFGDYSYDEMIELLERYGYFKA